MTVITENSFFGHDVTSHLMKHSFPLLFKVLVSYYSALHLVLSHLDWQIFIKHLPPQIWIVYRCIFVKLYHVLSNCMSFGINYANDWNGKRFDGTQGQGLRFGS